MLNIPLDENRGMTELETNQIYCGDCLDIMKNIPNEAIDLVITSPPYDDLRKYNGFTFDFENIAKELWRVIKKGGVVVWVVGDKVIKGNKSLTSFKQALYFQSIGFNVHDVMIYKKKNTPFMRSNAYTNCFEYMFIFSKGTPKTFKPIKIKSINGGVSENVQFNKQSDGLNKYNTITHPEMKCLTNIWEYSVGLWGTTGDKFAFKHPAMFPEKLAQDHILSWSNEGDLILDPMCGAGTTLKMAKLNKRNYIGIDISQEYVDISKQRVSPQPRGGAGVGV